MMRVLCLEKKRQDVLRNWRTEGMYLVEVEGCCFEDEVVLREAVDVDGWDGS
jgi:hypothetical protein